MIYVTGDLHGDLRRLQSIHLRARDTLIVAGDFGFLWRNDLNELRVLEKLGKRPFTTLFIDGTHENHTALNAYPTTFFGGAEAHRLGRRLYHVLRGQVLELENKRIFLMGGGDSTDTDVREQGVTWWKEESPTEEECKAARELLGYCGDRMDYIITHEPPQSVYSFLHLETSEFTPLRAFFDTLSRELSFKHWYFGSVHQDKKVTPLYTAVFSEVIKLSD